MMIPTSFQQELEENSGMKLRLKINDNRSTMLSVRWEPDCTKVSVHRMFLQAPQNVMQSLACYIRQEDKVISPHIKYFIEENIKKLDYSHLISQEKLYSQGAVYNLQKIYNDLNRDYFKNHLNLLITWFGKHNKRNRTRVTFGLYHDPLKLIKINRLLDSPLFPDYVVAYVIYHEMLHNVCPSYHDERGIHRIHSKEFKERELEFKHYNLAQNWINGHHRHLFKGMF
jgi:hypothetical protein